MAKVKIQGHASGTGVLTVTAPNTSTDRTITLPDGDVTMGVGINDNANATAITIDSSENVMVTKTSLNDAVVGVELRANGIVVGSADGNVGAVFNRNSSDGDIIAVKKGGTTVGSIGVVNTNNPFISNDADNSGLQFGTNQILPHYDNLQRDNAVDLGSSSVRFKDLYLSGGLKVGGTDAAHTLDDYEEGVYQYTITGSTGGSMTPKSGYEYFSYTKIGRQVTVIGKFETSGSHNATGYLKWSLPFAVGNFADQSESGAGTLFLYRTGLANVYNPTLVSSAGFSFFYSYYNTISNNEVNTLDGGNVDSTIEGFVHFTYFTD